MKKILVVDDSVVDQKNLQRILMDAGCSVTLALSGVDAIAKVHSDKPDLIMLDVNMPEAGRRWQKHTDRVCDQQRPEGRPRVCPDAGCQGLRYQALYD
jgi:CheY-like chemotaxis protein